MGRNKVRCVSIKDLIKWPYLMMKFLKHHKKILRVYVGEFKSFKTWIILIEGVQ